MFVRNATRVGAFVIALLLLAGFESHASVVTRFEKQPSDWKFRYIGNYSANSWFDDEGSAFGNALAHPSNWTAGGCYGPPYGSPSGPWTDDGESFGQIVGQYRDYYFHFWAGWPACATQGAYSSSHGLRLFRNRDLECPSNAPWSAGDELCIRTADTCKNTSEGCGRAALFGDPIHSRTGDNIQNQTDFVSPTSALLRFERFYRSAGVHSPSTLGKQWRHTFARGLRVVWSGTPKTLQYVIAYRHDGPKYYYVPDANGAFYSDSDVNERLARVNATNGALIGWTLTLPDDTIETYSADGILLSIERTDGDKVTVAYDYALGRIDTVTDRQGRTLRFAYTVFNPASGSYLTRLTELELPDGQRVAYEYHPSMMLAKATYPDDTPAVTTDNPARSYVYGEGTNGTPERLTGIVDELGNRFVSWRYDSSGRANLSVLGTDTSYVDRVELTACSCPVIITG